MIAEPPRFQAVQNGICVFDTGLEQVADDEYRRLCESRNSKYVRSNQFGVTKSRLIPVAVSCKCRPGTTTEDAVIAATTTC